LKIADPLFFDPPSPFGFFFVIPAPMYPDPVPPLFLFWAPPALSVLCDTAFHSSFFFVSSSPCFCLRFAPVCFSLYFPPQTPHGFTHSVPPSFLICFSGFLNLHPPPCCLFTAPRCPPSVGGSVPLPVAFFPSLSCKALEFSPFPFSPPPHNNLPNVPPPPPHHPPCAPQVSPPVFRFFLPLSPFFFLSFTVPLVPAFVFGPPSVFGPYGGQCPRSVFSPLSPCSRPCLMLLLFSPPLPLTVPKVL